jgi:hypothetical protein
MSVVAAILAALLFALDKLQSFVEERLTWWLPLWVIEPLLAHEIVALSRRARQGSAQGAADHNRFQRLSM